MTAEALVELGFNKRMATILSLLDEVPDNVQSRENIKLLGQCVDLNTLKEPLSGILVFLTREYETNLFMMSVPEKYGLTPQERKKYLSNPFNWEYECDLKEELDEQLQQIFTDKEKRMSIYRKLYLKGEWWACSVIRSSCKAMLEIADDAGEVEKLISRTPSFFFREGTIRYIRALQAHFKPEAVRKIFIHCLIRIHCCIHLRCRHAVGLLQKQNLIHSLSSCFHASSLVFSCFQPRVFMLPAVL